MKSESDGVFSNAIFGSRAQVLIVDVGQLSNTAKRKRFLQEGEPGEGLASANAGYDARSHSAPAAEATSVVPPRPKCARALR